MSSLSQYSTGLLSLEVVSACSHHQSRLGLNEQQTTDTSAIVEAGMLHPDPKPLQQVSEAADIDHGTDVERVRGKFCDAGKTLLLPGLLNLQN